MQKKHVNKIQVKLSNTGKDRICATINHIHYIMKEGLDFCKYYATENINQKLLYKAAEDCDLNMGEMIYIDIISQKKPSD